MSKNRYYQNLRGYTLFHLSICPFIHAFAVDFYATFIEIKGYLWCSIIKPEFSSGKSCFFILFSWFLTFLFSIADKPESKVKGNLVSCLKEKLDGEQNSFNAMRHNQQTKYLTSKLNKNIDDEGFTRDLHTFLSDQVDKYAQHIVDMKDQGMPDYKKYNTKNLSTLLGFIQNWRNILTQKAKSDLKIRKIEKHIKITPNDIVTYKESSCAGIAKSILDSSKSVFVSLVNQTIHTIVRNFIIFHQALTTGHRRGCIMNMKGQELSEWRKPLGLCISAKN